MRRILIAIYRLVAPPAEQLRYFLFRPILAKLEQQRRETLELERLLLTIARIDALGETKDPPSTERQSS